MRTLFLCLSVSLLTACGGSTPSADPLPSATLPCSRPVALPDHGLSDRDVEIMWGRDRRALMDCAGQVEVLAGR